MTAFQDWWQRTYPDEQVRTRAGHIKAVAKRANVAYSTIYTLLRGATMRNAAKAKQISAATDGAVTPGELLGL